MVSIEDPTMAKALPRPIRFSIIVDRLLFAAGGATLALLLSCAFYFTTTPNCIPNAFQSPLPSKPQSQLNSNFNFSSANLLHDPPATSFYDDPSLSYTIDQPIENWDEKRRRWLDLHPSFIPGSPDRILMVTGSQHGPCRNPVGDHLLLRFYKNKADYCRIHGHDLFYNTALLNPGMTGCWAKLPLVRAAMVAHPEAEWVWWVDEDAAFTDMEFHPPLARYRAHNLVVPGWPYMVFEAKSWIGLNAGVFLLRNCQWSLDFLAAWARMGPQTPDYAHWGKVLVSELNGKITADSDDQSALVYLIIKQKAQWADKIYIENEYDLHGYWLPIVGKLENITEEYIRAEREVKELRWRRAEKVSGGYGERSEKQTGGSRRPFVTHFAGCQPCGGGNNPAYSWESCFEGMQRALNFADDQVLRAFGFGRAGLLDNATTVQPLPFDFPAA